MKKFGIFTFLVWSIGMSGCSPTASTQITAAPSSPSTVVAAASPTPSRPTAEVVTPTPTETRLMGLPEHIDFPEWMKDRETSILLTPMGEDENFEQLSFIAAGSWERFDLPADHPGGFFWLQDGSGFGLLGSKDEPMAIVDIASGNVSLYPAPQKNYIEMGYGYPRALVGFGDYSDPSSFVLAPPEYISSDGQYLVDYGSPDDYSVTITNIMTGKAFQLPAITTANSHYSQSAWSPVSPVIAIEKEMDCEVDAMFPSCKEYILQVYDAPTGRLVGSYKNIANFSWSPDGLQILHSQNAYEWNGGLNPPCIFEVLDGKTECFNEVYAQQTSGGMIISSAWSPDMQKIGYIYDSIIDDGASIAGGFCLITIATHDTNCPVTAFGYPGRLKKPILIPHSFRWSPDGRFVVLHLKAQLYGSDDGGGPPLLAILDVNTGTYEILDEHVDNWQKLGLWRPLP